mmetsp:Transcript_7109/g.17636  ORF Transcript_7109/g.17636 Transcript_7109/m.17636 type:complete len:210 (-) Transcript_7109:835-1464(-)
MCCYLLILQCRCILRGRDMGSTKDLTYCATLYSCLLVHCAKFALENLDQLRDERLVRQWHAALEWIEREVRVLTDAPTDEYFASGNGHHLTSLLVHLAGGTAHDANVGCLHLTTAVRASGPMNANRSIHGNQIFQLLGDTLGVRLRLDQRQSAELRPGTADNIPLNEARVHLHPRISVERTLLQQRLYLVVVDVWQDDVLFDGQSDLAV